MIADHVVARAANPITDGVMRWTLGTTETDATTSALTTLVVKTLTTDVVVADAWAEIVTPFNVTDLRLSIGDADGDDTFLLPVQVGSTTSAGVVATSAAAKGQKLSDHRSGRVVTNLTISIDGGSGLPSASTAGEVDLYVRFAEVRSGHRAEDPPAAAGIITSVGYIGAPTKDAALLASSGFARQINASAPFVHTEKNYHKGAAGSLNWVPGHAFTAPGAATTANGDTLIEGHWYIDTPSASGLGNGTEVASCHLGAHNGSGGLLTGITVDLALYSTSSGSEVKVAEKTGITLSTTTASPPELQRVVLATSDLTVAGGTWVGVDTDSLVLVLKIKQNGSGPGWIGSSDVIYVSQDARGWTREA